MNTIEKIYTNYDGLLEEFSEEVIQSRYAVFYEEIEEFAKSLGIREKIQISESLLSCFRIFPALTAAIIFSAEFSAAWENPIRPVFLPSIFYPFPFLKSSFILSVCSRRHHPSYEFHSDRVFPPLP